MNAVVALHEAAHAVVFSALKIPVRSVSIFATASSAGRCRTLPKMTEANPCHWVIALFASGAAVRSLYPVAIDPCDAEDRRQATAIASAMFYPDAEKSARWLAHCEALATGYVQLHSDWIRAVSSELIRRRSLSGEEVLTLKTVR